MKKTNLLHYSIIALLAAVIPFMQSCKEDKADTGDLLSTVPSSASLVVGVNIKSVAEKAGCKVDGTSIKPGDAVNSLLNGIADKGSRENLDLLLEGKSGVDPTSAIVFMDAYGSYLTGRLADTGKFSEFVEKQNGAALEKRDGGVMTSGNVAVKGAQFWLNLGDDTSIDAKAISNYCSLSESQSFISNPVAPKISEMSTDVAGWGQYRLLVRSLPGLDFRETHTADLILSSLFDDATAIYFTADCQKGKAEIVASVLNDKGKNAKYVLPVEKIDVATVKSIKGTCDMLGAIGVSKDFIGKLSGLPAGLGLGHFVKMVEPLKEVQGTCAVALDDNQPYTSAMNGVVSTAGEPSLELLNFLSSFVPTRKEGKFVYLKNGNLTGSLDVEKDAELLRGATFGFITSMNAADKGNHGVNKIAFCLVPASGGIDVKVTLFSADTSHNILLSSIEAAGK